MYDHLPTISQTIQEDNTRRLLQEKVTMNSK